MKKGILVGVVWCLGIGIGWAQSVTGTVMDETSHEPLPYSQLVWMGTTLGTISDADGKFSLPFSNSADKKLIIKSLGYETDTLEITATDSIAITLKKSEGLLGDVVVTGTMKEMSKMDSPISVEVYSPALFRKNPSPTLFESLNMVTGVQPQINCNVCNTGDIHINGLEGPYTMILIDGMPIVSSLSTVYGLSGIPQSLVKRIEIVKGPASTLYGSEALAGLINVITKDPVSASRVQADVSGTSIGEFRLMSVRAASGAAWIATSALPSATCRVCQP